MSLLLAETKWGTLWLDPTDIVGRTLLGVEGDHDWKAGRSPARADGHFWDGDLLLPLYAECARPGTFVIIIGANFGQDALACAQLGAGVLAVEANPILVRALQDTMSRNEHGQAVHVLNWVAYDRRSWFQLAQLLPDLSSQAYVPVELDTTQPIHALRGGPIDPWVTPAMLGGRRISLVQVDAQGCDLRALVGLEETLRTHRPVVVFEWEQDLVGAHGDDWDTVRTWAQAMGYLLTESSTHKNNWIGRPQ